jgi:hypothetical protein
MYATGAVLTIIKIVVSARQQKRIQFVFDKRDEDWTMFYLPGMVGRMKI